jgi:predicted nucleotidyltransferase
VTHLDFSTPTHQKAYELVRDLLFKEERVLALALMGSAARNEGSFDSDLDFNIFSVKMRLRTRSLHRPRMHSSVKSMLNKAQRWVSSLPLIFTLRQH